LISLSQGSDLRGVEFVNGPDERDHLLLQGQFPLGDECEPPHGTADISPDRRVHVIGALDFFTVCALFKPKSR